MTAESDRRTERDLSCPECDHGTLRVSDAVYVDCDNCDAAVLRTEVGI